MSASRVKSDMNCDPKPASPALSIGAQLKSMFNTVAAAPLPREISGLIERLERREAELALVPRRPDRRC